MSYFRTDTGVYLPYGPDGELLEPLPRRRPWPEEYGWPSTGAPGLLDQVELEAPLATLDIVTEQLGPGHWCAQVVVRAGAAQALAAAAAAELEGGDELGAADLLCHTGWCGPYLPSPADVPPRGELLAGGEGEAESEREAVASAADAAARIVELVRRHPELAVALVPGAGAALATVAAAARHTGVARELYKALPSPAKKLLRDGAKRASRSVASGLKRVFG